jgi:hypothetical protein
MGPRADGMPDYLVLRAARVIELAQPIQNPA